MEQATDRRARSSLPRSGRPLLAVWMACMIGLLTIGTQSAVPVEDLVLDPAALRGSRWYEGMVTSLGVLGWAVAVCFCALTAFVAGLDGRSRARRVFLQAAIFFGFLLFDDLFLLHSAVLPPVVGLSKRAILLSEALLGGCWVLAGYSELARTRWPILVSALASFAGSLVVDAIASPMSGSTLLLEDGFKVLGIAALATWSVLTALDIIRSVVVSRERLQAASDRRERAVESSDKATPVGR